jgi:hypothetical protein
MIDTTELAAMIRRNAQEAILYPQDLAEGILAEGPLFTQDDIVEAQRTEANLTRQAQENATAWEELFEASVEKIQDLVSRVEDSNDKIACAEERRRFCINRVRALALKERRRDFDVSTNELLDLLDSLELL